METQEINLTKTVYCKHNTHIMLIGMTPFEYRDLGSYLTIRYDFTESPFGPIIVASTNKGVCYLAFYDGSQEEALNGLKKNFPKATYRAAHDILQQDAVEFFTRDQNAARKVKLHVKGTAFQLRVWGTLLSIPMGGLTAYAAIAKNIEYPKASRAVGSAVGSNPVAFLIPCHRVVKTSGEFGQYRWGSLRKTAMIQWESAHAKPLASAA